MADETLFTDILTRLRPGYKVGGVVTTPKRGFVDEPGSYSGEPTRFTDAQKSKIYKLTKEGKNVDFILEELKKEPDFPKFKSKKNIDVPRQRMIGLINKNPSIPKKFKIIPTGQKGQNLTYQAYSDLKKKVANLYKKQNVKNVSAIAKELYPEDDIVISQRKIRTLLKDAGVREIAEPTQKLKGKGKNFNDSQKRTNFRRKLSDAYIERKSTGNLADKIEFHHADSKNLNSKILTAPNRVTYLPKEINSELMPRDAYISKLYDQRESLGPRPKNKKKLKIWKKEWDRINKAGNDFVTNPKSKGLLNFKVIDDVSGKVLDVGIDESKMIMRTPDLEIPGLYGEDDYLGNKPFKKMTRIEKDNFLSKGKKKYGSLKNLIKEIKNVKNFAAKKGFELNSFAGALNLSQANIDIPPSVRQSLTKIVSAGKTLGKGAVVLDPLFATMDFSKAMGEGLSGKESASYTGQKFLQDIANLPRTLEDLAYVATDKGTFKNFGEKENRLFSYEPAAFADRYIQEKIEATPEATKDFRKARIDYAKTLPIIDDMDIPMSQSEAKERERAFYIQRGVEPPKEETDFTYDGIMGIVPPKGVI